MGVYSSRVYMTSLPWHPFWASPTGATEASLTVPQLRAALRTLGLEDSGAKQETNAQREGRYKELGRRWKEKVRKITRVICIKARGQG